MLGTLLVTATLLGAPPPPRDMGAISFPVTGKPACKKLFLEGMLAMHSFMYDDALAAFEGAVKADEGCAMARWGIAMSYTHPLWREEETAKSRAALEGITNAAALTPKERDFLESARALFGTGAGTSDFAPRLAAWESALARMQERYPGDDEIVALRALALIANSERLTKTRPLMESAALSMDVLRRSPKHPGATHYLIHACDTPDHAILALPAARQYAKIAPAASHALHMPAHIFVQLGMWKESAESNEASWAASQVEYERWKKGEDERDWHSYAWLVAAYLELGETKKADTLIESLREHLKTKDGPFARAAYALSTYAWLSNTGRWEDAEARVAPLLLPLPLEPGQAEGSVGCATHAPGGSGMTRPPFGLYAAVFGHQILAEAAMMRGDEKAVRAALDRKQAVMASMEPWKSMTPKNAAEETLAMENAFIAVAKARAEKTPQANETAVATLRTLTTHRERIPNGPAFETPYFVHLGEFLLEIGRAREARAAFDAALERYPNTSRARLGSEKSARAETARKPD